MLLEIFTESIIMDLGKTSNDFLNLKEHKATYSR